MKTTIENVAQNSLDRVKKDLENDLPMRSAVVLGSLMTRRPEHAREIESWRKSLQKESLQKEIKDNGYSIYLSAIHELELFAAEKIDPEIKSPIKVNAEKGTSQNTHRQTIINWLNYLEQNTGTEFHLLAVIAWRLLSITDPEIKNKAIEVFSVCRQRCLSAEGLKNICESGMEEDLPALIAAETYFK